MFKVGDKSISKLFLGDRPILKAYLGEKLVFQASKPIFLDYVEFDGASFIDTGLFANSNWKVRAVWETLTNSRPIYGSYESGKLFSSYVGANWRFDGTVVSISAVDKTPLGAKYTTIHDKNGVEVNGTLYPYQATPKEFTASNLSFCVGISNSSNLGYYKGKLYGLAIWDNDVLILDLRPCIDHKGVVCMYDMVTKKYFYNQRTGTLTAGNVIKFVDYIITDGSSYIDTEYCPNENTYIEYTFEVTQKPTASYNGLFGSRQDTAYYPYNVFATSAQTFRIDYGRYIETTHPFALNTKYTMKCGNNEIYINNELVKSYTVTYKETSPYSMFLGNFNNKGTPYTTGTPQKIYPCKIWENNILVRDFKPCIVAGEAGFYDKVTGKVFTNAGTGTLKASGRFVESIIFDGACVVDTGIAHQTCKIECDIRFEETGTRQLMGFGSGTGQYWGAGATGIFDYMAGTNALDRTFVTLDFNTTDIRVTVNADGVTRLSSKGAQITTLKYRIGAAPTGVSSNAYWCTCEIWSNKAYVNGEIIQDLRPYVDENGVACFKDVVTGNLFYNKGTGTLTYTE